jgi:diguanylate cyclase (GGDEF)-like protein
MSRRPTERISVEVRRRLAAIGLASLVIPGLVVGRTLLVHGEVVTPVLVLTVLFAVTMACPVDLWLAGRARRFDLSAAPLAAGLLIAHANDVVVARTVAVMLVAGLWQGRGRRTAVDAVPVLAGTATALLALRLLVGGAVAGAVPAWAAAAAVLATVCLSGLVESAVAALLGEPVRAGAPRPPAGPDVTPDATPDATPVAGPARGRRARRRVRRRVRKVALAHCLGTEGGPALIGVLSALAAGQGRVVLVVGCAGSAVLLAHRTFVSLAERQGSLERLYELSGALADAPTRSDVVGLALHRAADLLQAGYAEVILADAGADAEGKAPVSWSLRRGHGVYGPQDCVGLVSAVAVAGMPFPVERPVVIRGGAQGAAAFLAARGVREALVVPLRVDGAVCGQLTVADPLRDIGGFGATDLRLLETVANHASVALRNTQLLDRLSFEARHDELTGLPNRLQFRELLDEAAERAGAGQGRCSVMLLDFDGFKAINDTLGHQAGDDLLRVLAGRLAVVAGDEATVARLGGDEFAVLSTSAVTAGEAEELAGRLLAVFDEPVAVAGTRLRVGGSLGIALGPRQGLTGSDLMRNADIAMYAAKEAGSGPQLYDEALVATSTAVLALASDLPEAIGGDGIDIAVQPIVALAGGGLHSVEVLARWHHPELGEIDPHTLFEAAERSGQVTALSLRILDRALLLSRVWHDAGSSLRVCVNLAPRWLADPQLPDHVAAALAHHGLPPDVLGLEITERSVIADPTRAIQTLARLRDLGVHLSVDDFGTGYSSLTYLSRLPVDQLKIDNTFVQSMTTNPRDHAIVSSIVHLGGALGLEVVAEGIVDPDTRAVLLELGCRLGQGYLFTRPMDPSALQAFVAARPTAGLPVQRDHASGSIWLPLDDVMPGTERSGH